MKRDRYADRAAAINAATKIAAQAAQQSAPPHGKILARFLAVAGAHITVERDEHCPHPFVGHPASITVACEGCGPVVAQCVSFTIPDEDAVTKRALTVAQEHASICRRIPERLWPKDGAR